MIEKDFHHAVALANSIGNQTRKVGEFVLVASGLNPNMESRLWGIFSDVAKSVKIIRRRRVHSAGSNRMVGVKSSSLKFVSFIDADDLAHPQRNEILEERIAHYQDRNSEVPVILHSYIEEPRDAAQSSSQRDRFSSLALDQIELAWTLPEERVNAIRARFSSTSPRPMGLRFEELPNARIHHAPITAPRHLFDLVKIRPRPLHRNEDVMFLNEAITKGVSLEFLDAPLICYRVGWKTAPAGDEERYLNPFFGIKQAVGKINRLRKRTSRRGRRWVGRLFFEGPSRKKSA